jgi:hypothetical protein
MPEDPAYAEIRALRERLARLETYATAPPTERSNPVIDHAVAGDFATREERRLRDHASTYRREPFLERLHGLAAKAEAGNLVAAAELAAMTPAERMMLGYYATARAAAVELKLADATTGEAK